MLSSADEKRVLRALGRAKCVLFLGAGFSAQALDKSGNSLPVGSQLALELWNWCGLAAKFGTYGGQSLQRVYEIALKRKGERQLTGFLRDRLTASTIPTWYNLVSSAYWHRIYTTNIDNVVETVFSRTSSQTLDIVDGLHERPRDRDPFLERLQYVKLNGDLRHGSERITFGDRAYARRAVEVDPWWDQFVRDYSQHVTVFVGTSLNEPLLLQALEARGPRGAAPTEGRPGSFLVSKPLDPTVALSLDDLNVEGIEATAEEFLTYLIDKSGPRPDRMDILGEISPEFVGYVHAAKKGKAHADAAAAFLSVFDPVRLPDVPRNYSSLFHQGAEPTWLDIAAGMDASREVATALFAGVDEAVATGAQTPVIALSGPRGTGKTTLMMRAAAKLAGEGVSVFFTRGERFELLDGAMTFIADLPSKVVLFIDNADSLGRRGVELIEEIRTLRRPPVIVLGVRSSGLFFLEDVAFEELPIKDLTSRDVDSLIEVLKAHRSLGRLTDAGNERIRQEFEVRADKVLLVALKEATLSEGFREILRREFLDLALEEHQIIYLCAALAGAEESSLLRGQLTDCSTLSFAEAQAALERDLRGVVVRKNDLADRWSARHPLIASDLVEKIAPRILLATAYKRILSMLASDMDARAKTGEPARAFRLYRRLINHSLIYSRFNSDISEARGIYGTLEARLSHDAHFWLQYGSLELEYGELDWAERHLSTAIGLAPNDYMVRTAWASLKYAQAVAAKDLTSAIALRKESVDQLDELINLRGDDSPYPWHVKLTRGLRWVDVWVQDPKAKQSELELLRQCSDEACEVRPQSKELREMRNIILREYLKLTTV